MTSSVVVCEPKNGSKRAGRKFLISYPFPLQSAHQLHAAYDLRPHPDASTLAKAQSPNEAYVFSKILSHNAASEFMRSHPEAPFDLVRILPGYIQGAHELYTSPDQLSDSKKSGSNEGVMNTALGNFMNLPRISAQVLLDDVAKAHVLALREDVAKGWDNFSVVGTGGNSVDWREYVPIVERLFLEAVREGVLRPEVKDESFLTYWDVEESEKRLGFKFAGAEEMVASVVGQYMELVRGGMKVKDPA